MASAGAPPALTLFLAGLFEASAGLEPAEALHGTRLDALERLLARGRTLAAPGGAFEPALFDLFGIPVPAGQDPPVAAVTRLVDGGLGECRWCLRADPVHLRPDLSKVVLFDARAVGLTEAEAGALAELARPLLAELGGRLEAPTPDRWYLSLPAPVRIHTSPLSAALGQDLRGHLPAGPDERSWRALLTEVQMAFHGSPVNAEREARGAPVVNSLWCWGGGAPPAAPARRWAGVWSDDPLAVGLARLAGSAEGPLPSAAADWPVATAGPGEHLVVSDALLRPLRYGDLEGWRQAVTAAEERWAGPLLEALAGGRLSRLALLGGAGRGVTLTRATLRRWWRRPRPLAEALGHRFRAP